MSSWTDVQEMQAPSNAAGKSAFDDDFADFDNLDEAKMSDDRGFDFGDNRSDNEFNPSFDSPAPSTIAAFPSAQPTPTAQPTHPSTSNGFHDFESSTNYGQQESNISSAFGQSSTSPTQQASNHDWDAIFSGLDGPAANVEPNFGGPSAGNNTGSSSNNRHADAFDVPTPKASSPALQQATREMPKMGRALSSGTEHDDPILKRLTGMGYPRQKALDALEKYDYDINRVSLLS